MSAPDKNDEFESLCRARCGQHVQGAFHGFTQIEVEDFKDQFAGFDFGKIQNVVDDRQQRFGAVADGLGEFALLVGQIGIEQQAVMPMTPFIGVRISWLMLARNSLLARAVLRGFLGGYLPPPWPVG